jgi:CheY-like chemotaxis protein
MMSNTTNKALKILLVEDEPIAMVVNRGLLKNLGYTVDTAVNGKEAIAKAADGYDLIFMDVGLPDIDGIEATKEIRHQEDQAKRAVIVALTGYAQADIHAKCREAGMDDVLLKPTDDVQLKHILQSI